MLGQVGRRQFLIASGALLVAPLGSAQGAGKVHRIGWLAITPRAVFEPFLAAFERGMRERGYVAGRDFQLELRSAEGKPERLPELARELVAAKVDVIVTGVNPVTTAAKEATREIPIVFVIGSEVIVRGFAKSFARPGWNLTGLSFDVAEDVISKRFEFLKEAAPAISRVAVLFDPPYPEEVRARIERQIAPLKLRLAWRDVTDDFEGAFAAVAREPADAVMALGASRQFARRAEIVALAAKHRLPAAYPAAEFADAGGLMSYGPSVPDLFRRAAAYVDKILKGAKPGDLPVEQPTKIDLVINLKSAKALGLKVPQPLIVRAERVID
jgi:putative ABC transport system substrate-binding protein